MDEGVYYYVESLLKQMSDSVERINSLCQSIVGGGGGNIEEDWGLN
jgi:hypothetical protein